MGDRKKCGGDLDIKLDRHVTPRLLAHYKQMEQAYRDLPLAPPPAPWRLTAVVAVSGLMDIGFPETGDLLLVASRAGRGIYDASTGERVARDTNDQFPTWRESLSLTCIGVGPLAGKSVRMAGVHGGGLPRVTHDRWSLHIICAGFGEQYLMLNERGAHMPEDNVHKIMVTDEPTAYGFSYTGDSFAVAEGAHSVYLFTRIEPS